MKKINWKLLAAVIAVPIGNRVFNHGYPWIGIAIIVAATTYSIYQLIKSQKTK